MKKILGFFVVFLLITRAYAAEGVLTQSVSLAGDQQPANSFGLVVTGSGRLIIKPGAVFTQGDDLEGAQLPYLLDHPKPISYPQWAVSSGAQGKMVIAVEIREDGTVGLQKVMQSTGHARLDREATEALQSWKFHPAMKEGKPMRTCIQIPIRFQLQDE